METVTQPAILSATNAPYIIIALVIAVGMVILNNYLTKKASLKH